MSSKPSASLAPASLAIASWAISQPASAMSAEVIHFARRTLLDTVAVAIAGKNEPASNLVLRHALSGGPQDHGASIWSDGACCSPEDAALANGTMAHVLDYDDVSSPQRGHPGVVLWPAIAALAEANAVSEHRAMVAYVIGLEIVAKLGRLMAVDHIVKGWHSTPTLGVIGAAVGCSYLLDLSPLATAHAIGIAFAHAAGSRENFGTMSKSLQAGIAASAGVRAARLAAAGFESSPDALDGPAGFMALYGNGEDLTGTIAALGQPLEALSSGVEVKRYPACYATHRTIDAILALREEHGLNLENVAQVDVIASNKASLALVHSRPATSLEAKFSMEYAVATALHDGSVGLRSFCEDAVLRPSIQAFLPYVHSREADGPVLPRTADVTVTTRDGHVYRKRVEKLHGSAESPLTDEELRQKVRDCLSFAHAEINADRLCDRILNPPAGSFGSPASPETR